MAKSKTAGSRKRKNHTNIVTEDQLEIIGAAQMLIQLSGSSDTNNTIYYDAEEEESVGKTTPTAGDEDDDDQVSSWFLKQRALFDDDEDDELGFGKRIGKKRYRAISDLYKVTKPLKMKNGGGVVVNKKRKLKNHM